MSCNCRRKSSFCAAWRWDGRIRTLWSTAYRPTASRSKPMPPSSAGRARAPPKRPPSKDEIMSGTIADLMVDTLAAAGVRRIYGLVGDSLNGFTDALRRHGGIDWIHVRHEEVAAFAAGADAHVTGELAVCAGSCGPGNLHLINGLFDCHRSRVPVVAIAAHIPSPEIGSGYFQETHPEQLFRECSGYCELVTNAEQMPRALEIAVRRATAERCVSVLVIPGDVALRRAPETPAPKPHGLVPARPTVTPPAETIERLAALLNQARSVTLLCGGGCEGAHDELLQLAETLKAPIVHALRGKEHVEWDNPYDVGMTGLIGFSSGYRAMESCDLLLMLGTDFPYRQFYPKDARVLRIELPIRKIRPQHEEQVAGFHRPISGREADQTGHADVVGIVPFDMLLATQGMDDRRLQGFGELQQFVMGALAAAAAQQS